MKYLKILVLFALIISVLCGCFAPGGSSGGNGGDGGDGGDDNEGKVKVLVTANAGITFKTQNPVYVNPGEDAKFEIEVAGTSVIAKVEGGTVEGNFLTVSNVTRDVVVKITTIDLGYDTTASFRYYFEATDADSTSIETGSKVTAGTQVTVSAKDKSLKFLGWSLKHPSTNPDDMYSTARELTFRLNPLMEEGGAVTIYANYAPASSFMYNPNGGRINKKSPLVSSPKYYTVETFEGKLKITPDASYREVYESVHLFYDDGTFTRDGYVLKEYNTARDGSGMGYSLGSMYYPDPDSADTPVLYCIWEPATPDTNFTYEAVEIDLPANVTIQKAPHWNVSGLKITGYSGDDETVVIPESINGIPVTEIGAGAFMGKNMKTLVLSNNLLSVEDGAFIGCASLTKVYYSDAIYYISDNAFDTATYENLKNFYVNATMAPRNTGGYSVKLSRLLASIGEKRIIVIAGSSTYQGFSSAYMEALMKNEYKVINFGTTRTTHGTIYLEAMKNLTTSRDIVLYAPENSTYMMGESRLYWKTLHDIECMNNFFRHIDISNYTGVLSAFADFNQNHRYTSNPRRYEDAYYNISKEDSTTNKYGENIKEDRKSLVENYVDVYFITINERIKSRFESQWDDVDDQLANKDYNDPDNKTWQSFTDPELVSLMNHAINSAKFNGAKVYFSFCPMDADKLVPESKNIAATERYDALIRSTYNFTGVLGESKNYIFAHEYFYDCAFHPNDIGRTFRTYRVYTDICAILGKTPEAFLSAGTDFEGCIFEAGSTGTPLIEVDYLK